MGIGSSPPECHGFMRALLCVATPCAVALAPACAAPQSSLRADSARFATATVFKLRNGMNPLDPTGKGAHGAVMVARRPNYNAHGYSLATFYVTGRDDASDHDVWQLIPFMAQTQTGE